MYLFLCSPFSAFNSVLGSFFN